MTLGTVVVVDDEEIIIKPVARFLRRLFRKEGLDYEIITSQWPEEILARLQDGRNEIALVISDIMMESMNGIDFIREIKTSYPDTLIIILTGYADQAIFHLLKEQLELYSYQEKPWNDDQLGQTVKNALSLFRRKRLLERYMPAEILDEVLMCADDRLLEGTELEATVLFLDFRDSTHLFSAEKMGPKKALQHLNRYFEALMPVLEKHGGVLDKFMGDGFMALFGVPYPSASAADDARHAVLAALEMREVVQRLNQHGVEMPMSINIGISTGMVIAGNVGTRQRANYTVLGGQVNIASRLQKVAKPLQDGILIGENTYRYVEEMVAARPYKVSATTQERPPLPAYEIVGIR